MTNPKSDTPPPSDETEIPALSADIYTLLQPRLGDFCDMIRRQPPCRCGFTSCRVFLLDGSFVDLETENGIDIPDEIVGDARAIAAEKNALAIAWALPHMDGERARWFIHVELPGYLELEARAEERGRGFGPFTLWEPRDLGPDTWTSLPVNLPRWSVLDTDLQAAPVETDFVASLAARDYSREIDEALTPNREMISRGAPPEDPMEEEDFYCLACCTRHTRCADGRIVIPVDGAYSRGAA